MKKIKSICIILICIFVFMSGCTADNNADTSSEEIKINTASDYKVVFSEKIEIYTISHKVMNAFLENPYHNILKDNCENSFSYPKDGNDYSPDGCVTYYIDGEFSDFWRNEQKVKEYLKENGINEKIENMAILDAPCIGLVIWIKTESEHLYVTSNEYDNDLDNPDIKYTYRFYKQTDFNNKFMLKEGKLFVEKKEIATKYVPQLYSDYAYIPLTSVFEGFGAEIVWKSDTKANIIFEGEKYILVLKEVECYHAKDKNIDLLPTIYGGYGYLRYLEKGDIMVSTTYLPYIMDEIGYDVSCDIDRENCTVTISIKNEEEFDEDSGTITVGGDCSIAIQKSDGKVLRIWFGE